MRRLKQDLIRSSFFFNVLSVSVQHLLGKTVFSSAMLMVYKIIFGLVDSDAQGLLTIDNVN
jgi:tyrosine-protein phosphatase YwqE